MTGRYSTALSKPAAAICLAATVTFSGPALADKIPGSDYASGNWTGAAYTNDQSGTFSHCAMSADYVRGETLYLSINDDASITLGVENKEWKLNEGATLDVSIRIDRNSPYYARGEVRGPKFFVANFDASAELFEEIRKGRMLVLKTIDASLDFSLLGTQKAMKLTDDCAAEWSEYQAAPTVEASAEPEQPPIEEAPEPEAVVAVPDVPDVPSATPNPPTPEVETAAIDQNAPAVDRAELLTIMTNVLSESGITGYRIMRKSEVPEQLAAYPVVWTATDILGFLDAISLPEGQTAATVASQIIGGDAQTCSGTFVSGSKPGEETGTVTVFTACQQKDGTTKADYNLIETAGILYIFGTGSVPGAKDDKSRTAATGNVFREASMVIGGEDAPTP